MKYPKRRGKPGARYETNDNVAGRIRLEADAEGVVEITNQDEARAADAFGLPVARKPKPPAAENAED